MNVELVEVITAVGAPVATVTILVAMVGGLFPSNTANVTV